MEGTPDPTAVIGRRISAWLLDAVFALAVLATCWVFLVEYVDIPPGAEGQACDLLASMHGDDARTCIELGDRAYLLSGDDALVQQLASWGWLVFIVVLQGVVGATPGKLVAGLRVVTADGNIAGVGRSIGRTLLWVVDGAPWIVPLVGPIVGLTSAGHRRVGDMAAGTYVIGRRDVGHRVAGNVTVATPPAGSPAWGRDEPDTAASTEPAEMPATEMPAAGPGTGELPPPQWDAGRGTYLQWMPAEQRWLQWDATAEEWKPIDS